MSAKIIRLQSGEELVANVQDNGGTFTLTNVTILLPTQSGSIQLAPFMPYAKIEDGLTISEDKVFFVVDPHEDLAKYHKDLFDDTPEILTPSKKIIV